MGSVAPKRVRAQGAQGPIWPSPSEAAQPAPGQPAPSAQAITARCMIRVLGLLLPGSLLPGLLLQRPMSQLHAIWLSVKKALRAAGPLPASGGVSKLWVACGHASRRGDHTVRLYPTYLWYTR